MFQLPRPVGPQSRRTQTRAHTHTRLPLGNASERPPQRGALTHHSHQENDDLEPGMNRIRRPVISFYVLYRFHTVFTRIEFVSAPPFGAVRSSKGRSPHTQHQARLARAMQKAFQTLKVETTRSHNDYSLFTGHAEGDRECGHRIESRYSDRTVRREPIEKALSLLKTRRTKRPTRTANSQHLSNREKKGETTLSLAPCIKHTNIQTDEFQTPHQVAR